MVVDPSTQTDNQIDPTAQMATELVTSNVQSMADKVQKVIEIIAGPNAKKYGVTAKNLQLGFMFAGIFMLTPKIREFLVGDKHSGTKGQWPKVLATVMAIIAIRKYYEGQAAPIIATNTPVAINPSELTQPNSLPSTPAV